MKNLAWKSGIAAGILGAVVYFALMREYEEEFNTAFIEIEAFGMGVLVFSLWLVIGKFIRRIMPKKDYDPWESYKRKDVSDVESSSKDSPKGSWAAWLVPAALGIYSGIAYYATYMEFEESTDIFQESLSIGIVLFIVGVAIMMVMDRLFPPDPKYPLTKHSNDEGPRKIFDALIKQPLIWISGHYIELIVLAIVNVFLNWAFDDAGPDFIFIRKIAVFFAGILVFVIWPRHVRRKIKKK